MLLKISTVLVIWHDMQVFPPNLSNIENIYSIINLDQITAVASCLSYLPREHLWYAKRQSKHCFINFCV